MTKHVTKIDKTNSATPILSWQRCNDSNFQPRCLEEKLKTRLTYRWRSVSQHFVYLDSCAVVGLITRCNEIKTSNAILVNGFKS